MLFRSEPFVAGQAESGNAPSCEIAEANATALRNNSRERSSARISGGQDAANAASGNAGDWNVVVFKDAKHTQVGIATGETAAKRQANAWSQRRRRDQERTRGWAARSHEGNISIRGGGGDGTHVLTHWYEGTR